MNQNKHKHLPIYGIGPIYGAVTFILTITGIILGNLPQFSAGKLTYSKIYFAAAGLFLILLGIHIWIRAVFIAKIDNGIKNNFLITSDIYAYVRNPIYSAIMIICSGALFISGNIFFFPLSLFFWAFMTILLKYTEEKWLLYQYGNEYKDYCKKVNRCIPCFPRK